MTRFTVDTIPHSEQRYDTVGDWQLNGPTHRAGDTFDHRVVGRDTLTVSEMGNPDYEFLVAIHELVEMHLCKKHGVTQDAVDKFDLTHAAVATAGKAVFEEPGDDPGAPYHGEHQAATLVERTLASVLGVDWDVYEHAIESLVYRK